MTTAQLVETLEKLDALIAKQQQARDLTAELRLRLILELELERRGYHWNEVVSWLTVAQLEFSGKRRFLMPNDIAGVIVKDRISGEEKRFEFDSAYPHIRTKERTENECTAKQDGPGSEASGPT